MHDYTPHETGEPRQHTPESPDDWLETLSRAVFNAGLAWRVVTTHWEAICDAFADFDLDAVAGFDEQDTERIIARADVIQSRNKIRAIPVNARTLAGIVAEHGSVEQWLATFDDYDARERELVRRFKFIGEFGAYWTLYTLEQPVPHYRDWATARGRDLPAGIE